MPVSTSDTADSEAELAGVLGHEVGHVTARHTAQRYDRQLQGQIGATVAQVGGAILGGILGGQAGSDLGGSLGGQLGSVGATAYVQGYSREQELQADELGVRYLGLDGYDPQAMATFLKTLNASDELRQRMAGGQTGATPSWLASHPRTVDRVERAIAAAGQAQKGGELDRDRYLEAIDGLVFGDSPAQGFVRGRSFIHPELGIRFDAPAGFKLRNTPQAVTGSDNAGRYLLFDAGQGQSTDAATYLQREWVSGQRLSNIQGAVVNGRQAAIGFGQVGFRNQRAAAMFVAVPGGSRTFYRFIFFDTGRLDSSDVATFETSLQSFGSLAPNEVALARPLRIAVVEVRPGDTVDGMAARMDVAENRRVWFVLLKDLGSRALTPGEKVKLVVREGSAAS
jgi:predicted Zn-dependent protease